MFFSIIIILLVGIIAYFHVVQGLFSSIISLICALVAALMAISYHEQLAMLGFKQKMTDLGYSLSLVAIFAVVYVVLRVVFDNVVPGNVRLPAIVDKVGGAILGAIAGALAMGILAVAAQALPVGPSLWGYGRYQLDGERDVKVPPSGHNQYVDTSVFDELKSDTLKEEDQDRMYVPVDDFLIGLVNKLSDGGSLEGDRKFASVHPTYLDELFFQRLGTQIGAKRVLVNTDKQKAFTVSAPIRLADALSQVSAEIPEIRVPKDLNPLHSDALHALLVVRVIFSETAGDTDHIIRMAPNAARLVANSTNYFPLGTLENGGLYQNKPDDYMFIQPNMPVDFVFMVDREDVIAGSAAASGGRASAASAMTVKDGVFIEIKRMARTSLGGMEIERGVVSEPSTGVIRKNGLARPSLITTPAPSPTKPPAAASPAAPSAPAPGQSPSAPPSTPPSPEPEAPATPSAPSTGGPISSVTADATDKLFTAINIGKHGSDDVDVKFKSGTASVKDGKLQKIELNPTDTLEDLAKGDGALSEVVAPAGTHVVIVSGDAASNWTWAENLSDFELVDSSGIPYKPNGAIAKLTKGGKDYLVGSYNADEPVEKIAKQDGSPSKVAIIFLIPDNTPLTALNFKGQKIADVSLK